VVVTTPTPAPPPYESGHFVGTTSQFQPISFDVVAGGIQNLDTGDVNQSCNPPFNLYGGNFQGFSLQLNADGSFQYQSSSSGFVGGSFPATDSYLLTGRVQGGIASGTLKEDTSFDRYSVGYVCSSGLVTWTTTLTP
jgi:hypothetical protein